RVEGGFSRGTQEPLGDVLAVSDGLGGCGHRGSPPEVVEPVGSWGRNRPQGSHRVERGHPMFPTMNVTMTIVTIQWGKKAAGQPGKRHPASVPKRPAHRSRTRGLPRVGAWPNTASTSGPGWRTPPSATSASTRTADCSPRRAGKDG